MCAENQVKDDLEEGENIQDWDSYLDEYDREIPEDNIFSLMTSDEILDLFDEDGNLIVDINLYDDSEILLMFLEKRYKLVESENFIPVDEVLATFDDEEDDDLENRVKDKYVTVEEEEDINLNNNDKLSYIELVHLGSKCNF